MHLFSFLLHPTVTWTMRKIQVLTTTQGRLSMVIPITWTSNNKNNRKSPQYLKHSLTVMTTIVEKLTPKASLCLYLKTLPNHHHNNKYFSLQQKTKSHGTSNYHGYYQTLTNVLPRWWPVFTSAPSIRRWEAVRLESSMCTCTYWTPCSFSSTQESRPVQSGFCTPCLLSCMVSPGSYFPSSIGRSIRRTTSSTRLSTGTNQGLQSAGRWGWLF